MVGAAKRRRCVYRGSLAPVQLNQLQRDGDTAAVGDEELATEYAGSQDRGSMSQKRTRISTANLLGRFGGANNIREVGFIIYQSVSQVAPAQQQRYCPILLEPWYLYFDIYPPHL